MILRLIDLEDQSRLAMMVIHIVSDNRANTSVGLGVIIVKRILIISQIILFPDISVLGCMSPNNDLMTLLH